MTFVEDTLTGAYMVKILFLEDSADDVELMLNELKEAGVSCNHLRVYKKSEFITAINDFRPHVVLADYSLPAFTGLDAFRIVKRSNQKIPFILVTGVLSERVALDCLNEGIDDFILKSSFKRLPAAIRNAMAKKKVEIEKERMALQLKKSNRDLQKLTEQLQVLREEERLHVARDLHDELGQMLTGLKIDLSMLWKGILSGKISDVAAINMEFSGVVNMVSQITQSVKRIVSGLRPEILYELGIIEAIRWQCQEFENRSKIACEVNINIEYLDVDRNISIALFRMVQETLTNIARHAQASQVKVQFSVVEGSLHLCITDNGIGISEQAITDSNALGLVGMRERARFMNGKFSISGKPGKGTRVLVIVPLNQEHALAQN